MSHATFAHPGGSELFEEVTFRVGRGRHVALVGPNGVGKTTLLRCVAGELTLQGGTATTDASVAYMPQAIGVDGDATTTVRALLTSFSSTAIRAAGEALARAEAANDAEPTERTGVALANAVIRWGEVDGYQHEARWDACCAAVLGQPLGVAGGRPLAQLSGGERKRLVLEMLFGSDHGILLLDEPDNFLDITAKRWLEDQINASTKTILFITHDRALLDACALSLIHILGLVGVAVIGSGALATLAGRLSTGWGLPLTYGGGGAISFACFLVAFRLLIAAPVRWRDVALGAALATVFWLGLQLLGSWYVERTVRDASDTYGFFAIVIALLSWMYLGAQLTLVAVEANVVGVHRLWPRSITQPPLTRGDRATFGRLARMEQRRPEYEVRMAVTPAADDDPLRDEADARDDADGSELGDDERGPAPLSPTPR